MTFRAAASFSFCLLGLAACQKAPAMADVTPAPASAGAPMAHDVAASDVPGPASARAHLGNDPGHAGDGTALTPTGHDQLAAFAAGCFWGVEDAFRHVPGVVATSAGYAGGHTASPTYEDVCTHTTGHAETVLVEYDPARVPYEQLLRVFWKIHDPTQVNRQGPDYGNNYRSVVFTFSDEQAAAAKASMQVEQQHLTRPIATEVRPIGPFYRAEAFHQQFAERTGSHACPIGSQLGSL
jgi:methionine-S-sulfoxide reductase